MLSDKVSTVRQVHRHNPIGNNARLLWLMLDAWISQVHRKPATIVTTANAKATQYGSLGLHSLS